MTTNVCLICTEKFNKSNRLPVSCCYCEFTSCRECCKTFLLNENTARCMNRECDKEWTRKFLAENFTQKFVNTDYKKHREDVLFQGERALLPATQPLVERAIRLDEIGKRKKEILDQILEHRKEINKLYDVLYDVQRTERRVQQGREDNTEIEEHTVERARFIRACPDPECRGFLSTQWKCGLCQKWSCPDCHEVKGFEKNGDHVCNPDNVATAQLLAADTKPCPSCGTGIFKIDGCDQMWCTDCHTAFSWRTGRIETQVHNPHYYEWLRRQSPDGQIPRNAGDNPQQGNCRELTNTVTREINEIFYHYKPTDKDKQEERNKLNTLISDYIRAIMHNRHVELPRYNYNYELNNQKLRIQYMRNLLTEDRFKELIQQKNKKSEKTREISNIYNILITASSDMILRIYDVLNQQRYNHLHRTELNFTEVYKILEEVNALRAYCNECFVEIGKIYKTKPIVIGKKLMIEQSKKND